MYSTRPVAPPTLHLHAMTDIRRDEATRMQTVRRLQEARVFDSTTPLVGQVLANEQPVILEDASTDASCQPLPPGLPPLGACMALPIHAAQELVAVVVLANSHSGYASADIQFLQPLLSTVGQLEMARRAEEDRRQVDAQLARTSALLGEKNQRPGSHAGQRLAGHREGGCRRQDPRVQPALPGTAGAAPRIHGHRAHA